MKAVLRDRIVRWRNGATRTRVRVLHRLAEFLVGLSTFKARSALRALGSHQILVDTSLLGHSVTHETAWIPTGTKLWGGVHPVDTGHMARIPVHNPNSNGRVYREVCYLVGLSELEKQGLVKLRTSAEIRAEIYRQPMGRFTGYGWLDLTLLNWGSMPSLDGVQLDMGDAKRQQLDRVAACGDPRYLDLLALLGPKMSLDAYHIYTAAKHGVAYFLHIDFPLAEKVRQNKDRPEFKSLGVNVMLPSEFGRRFGLYPIKPVVLSYRDSKFFVRPDLHWPDSHRRGAKKSEQS